MMSLIKVGRIAGEGFCTTEADGSRGAAIDASMGSGSGLTSNAELSVNHQFFYQFSSSMIGADLATISHHRKSLAVVLNFIANL